MHHVLVQYTHKVVPCDLETPEVSPAIVTKMHADQTANLAVFTSGGSFFVFNAPKGVAGEKGTWHV